MLTITLRQILAAEPCYDPRERGLIPHDHDLDAPISFREIIDVAGLDDAIWCLQANPTLRSIARWFALDCVERVRHLMTDPRSTNALDVARRYLAGEASQDELAAARDAAKDAARAAAWAAAKDAARAAAWDAAWDAAWAAERAWQAARLIELTEGDVT